MKICEESEYVFAPPKCHIRSLKMWVCKFTSSSSDVREAEQNYCPRPTPRPLIAIDCETEAKTETSTGLETERHSQNLYREGVRH